MQMATMAMEIAMLPISLRRRMENLQVNTVTVWYISGGDGQEIRQFHRQLLQKGVLQVALVNIMKEKNVRFDGFCKGE